MAKRKATFFLVPTFGTNNHFLLSIPRTNRALLADLPDPELVDLEAERWHKNFGCMLPDDNPNSCANTIKVCKPHTFPNIYVPLKIACTLLVTSCECERNCSVLRRLQLYSFQHGTTKVQCPFSPHVHYDIVIPVDELVKHLTTLHQDVWKWLAWCTSRPYSP